MVILKQSSDWHILVIQRTPYVSPNNNAKQGKEDPTAKAANTPHAISHFSGLQSFSICHVVGFNSTSFLSPTDILSIESEDSDVELFTESIESVCCGIGLAILASTRVRVDFNYINFVVHMVLTFRFYTNCRTEVTTFL